MNSAATKDKKLDPEVFKKCKALIMRRLNFYGLINHQDFIQGIPFKAKNFNAALDKLSDQGKIRISQVRYRTDNTAKKSRICTTKIYFLPCPENELLARKIIKNYTEYFLYRAKKEEENPWQGYHKKIEQTKLEYDKTQHQELEDGYYDKQSTEYIPSPERIKRLTTQFAILHILFPEKYPDCIHQRIFNAVPND